MSTHNKNRTEHIVEALSLPKDVLLGTPLVSMCGNRELHIDNHQGIVCYETELVVVRTKPFSIRIQGKNLMIEYYTADSIKLTGQITDVCLVS